MANDSNAETLPDALRVALAGRDPAAEAQDGALPAGVLVPLRFHRAQWHVILNVRSSFVSEHKGEIAFPGGRFEPEDADMEACALRETWEEMGSHPDDVDVLGQLDPMMSRTNYLIWPFVGVVPFPYEFTPNPREVAEVIEAPLSELLDPANARHEAHLLPDGSMWKRYSIVSGKHMIFGVTAWILNQLVALVNGALENTGTQEWSS